MARTPRQLLDQSTRHAAHLERLKTQDSRELLQLLEQMERELLGYVSQQDVSTWTRQKMNRRLSHVRSMMRESFTGDIIPQLNKQISDLAQYESAFEMRSLENVVRYDFDLPSSDQLRSAIRGRPLDVRGQQGKLLGSFIEDWTENQVTRTANTLRSGFARGLTTPQIVRQLREEAGPINRRGLEALTRTALNHSATEAREAVWDRNSDIISRVRWVSTLDLRTTTECASLDGRLFKVGEGPRPPLHVGCRSTTVAALDERFSFLEEGGTRRARDPETGLVTDAPAGQTYYGWLKDQPASVQDSIIGPTRGKLMRGGGLDSQRFAELQLNRHFEPMTLDQMRELEPVAFERAGID